MLQTTTASFMMEEDESYTLDQVSEHVASAQKALAFLDYPVGRSDGYFDASTAQALRRYQAEHNLEASGVLDAATLQSLVSGVRYRWSMDKSVDNQLQKAVSILNGE